MIRQLWLVLAISLLAQAAAAQSDQVVISSGRERGSYYYIGDRLKTELILQAQRVDLQTSRGSIENLQRLDDPESPVNVGLTQADALREYLREHPDFQSRFFVLGDVGRECVFIIAAAKSDVESLADLKVKADRELSIDDEASGSAVTWQAMARAAPELAATRAVSVPTMEALLQLESGSEFTKLAAAMIVQRPGRASPPLETVMQKPDLYRLVPIAAGEVPNAELPDGSDVYTFERVVAGGKARRGSVEVDTLCTRGLMLGSTSKLSSDQRSRLSTIMMEPATRKTIVGSDE